MENNHSLILSLIKEDLRCSKLVLGLSGLGLDAGKYHTELSTAIFTLMGIDHNNDQLLTLYFDCIDKVMEVNDVEDVKRMQGLAIEIYDVLKKAASPQQ